MKMLVMRVSNIQNLNIVQINLLVKY